MFLYVFLTVFSLTEKALFLYKKLSPWKTGRKKKKKKNSERNFLNVIYA